MGVQDKDKLLSGKCLEEGDILIGMQTNGIEGTSYPFIKIMLDKSLNFIMPKSMKTDFS